MELHMLLRSGFGIVVAFIVWLVLSRIIPGNATATLPERLGLAFASLLPAVCVLNLMIVVQMRLRMVYGAVDPLAGRDARPLQVNQRVLTNTVEQLVGFAPALLALAAGAPPGWMSMIVAAALVFALMRLAFWGGYLLGPLLRAPGMAATFAINVATMIAAIRVWWP
jgi:uncharacterized membrane protein YecN with MAPEG domain